MKRLGVAVLEGRPYNPRRQGSVESTHGIVEQWHEPKLRIQPATSVVDLNAWTLDFLVWFHATHKHSRHGMPRTACWSQIHQLSPAGHPRELPEPEVLREVFFAPVECTVFNNRIEFRGDTYNVKHLPEIQHRAKVLAHVNPLRWKAERVITVLWRDVEYDVAAIAKLDQATQGGFEAGAAIIGQEFRAQPETLTQRAVKQIEEIAGTFGKRNAVPFAGTPVFGHLADKVGNVVPLSRPGTPLDVGRDVVAKAIPVIRLIADLAKAGCMTPQLNAELKAEFGPAIEVRTAEAVRAAVEAGEPWRTAVPAEREAKAL
jgi:hypothetical protein